MAGVIYICSSGVDPAAGDVLTDPLFGPVPTLGACVPNLRRIVEPGDWLFVISGRKRNLSQYVIGGLRVAEKIDALAAYRRLPENRMRREPDGRVHGNIPVDEQGQKHAFDRHSTDNFERRIQNYIVGDRSLHLSTPAEVALSRAQTLPTISDLKRKQRNRVIDVMGRHAKLSNDDVDRVLDWLNGIKRAAHGQPPR